MSKAAIVLQRGAACCLALLFCAAGADESNLRDINYVLISSVDGNRQLLLLSPEDAASPAVQALTAGDDRSNAVRLVRSDVARERVRGLLLLNGETDPASLNLALELLNDPYERVRLEAAAIVAEHPLSDESMRTMYALAEDK